jgi:hypothetical protein
MADVSKLKQRRTLGAPPSPAEASTNLGQPENAPGTVLTDPGPGSPPVEAQIDRGNTVRYNRLDGRSLRRSNRVVQFATRVTPDFDQRIRAIAASEGLLIVEVLERALDAYESKPHTSRRKAAI